MGPYCNYCDKRCFVPNPNHSDPFNGGATILATCLGGQKHDKRLLGYCWDEVKDKPEREEVPAPKEVRVIFVQDRINADGQMMDTEAYALLTKDQERALWTLLFSSQRCTTVHTLSEEDEHEREQEQEPPQPKIPGFQTVEYKDYEITGPYIWEVSGNETFLVFPVGGQVAVHEAPTATACLTWIDEESVKP